ncbi:SDR family oxidoreductase [Streptomyces sp. RG80]|uniref:SDR family oxidoreductase n=1 Tax=Streptomyces sp. RG80 TaxID=3157340 RepID=UPI00338F0626
MAELGGLDGPFDVGANVPDAVPDRDTDLLGMDVEIRRRAFEMDFLGYTVVCRAAIPHLLAAGGGGIVNCSSGGAWSGLAVLPTHSPSRTGVNALIRHIASRWDREGLRCDAVAPGRVMTESLPRQGTSAPQPGHDFRCTRFGQNRRHRRDGGPAALRRWRVGQRPDVVGLRWRELAGAKAAVDTALCQAGRELRVSV